MGRHPDDVARIAELEHLLAEANQRLASMEKQLKRMADSLAKLTSRNSSLPPSQDPPGTARPTKHRKDRSMADPKSKHPFSDDVIDQLLAGYSKPEDLTGKDGILKQLTARLVERALQGEMAGHLGYDKGEGRERPGGNARNGTTHVRT